MKSLYLFFLLTFISNTNANTVLSPLNSISPNYNVTIRYYNTTNCFSEPYSIISTPLDVCDYSNMCIPFKNTTSLFKTCSIYNTSKNNSNLSVVLTLLITFLIFVLYKACCNTCLDNYCYSAYDSIYYCIFGKDPKPKRAHPFNYSSL